MTSPSANVKSRGDQFATRLETKITHETPNRDNPYQVECLRMHGYEHTALMEKCEFSAVIFLLFRGELPNNTESELFKQLCIALINPGPRHPATQGSMVAGVGKTISVNVLPIALSLYGGDYDSAGDVEAAMRLFRRKSRKPASAFVDTISHGDGNDKGDANDEETLPGFGTLYGDPDAYARKLLEHFATLSPTPVIQWLLAANSLLAEHTIGVTKAGVCAAVLADLGFLPRQGCGLMQLMAAPGLLAHGVEYANKPITSMLFESDDNYEIETTENTLNGGKE